MRFMTWRRSRTVAVAAGPLLAGSLISASLLAGCGGSGTTTPPFALGSVAGTPAPVGTPTPGATPTPTASATPVPVVPGDLTPPYAGKVAFVSRRDATERGQLFVMNPDGSQVTEIKPLTSYPSTELQYPGNHYMSADGSKFLLTYDFSTGAGAVSYLVNADGTNLRDITALLDPTAVTNGGTQPVSSVSSVSMNANGTQLVFAYRGYNRFDASQTLITMNDDGSARTTHYTAPTGQEMRSPIFAPDGQTLYFVQGTEAGDGSGGFTGTVYRLAPGATTPTPLATTVTLREANHTVFPALSIDASGTKVAFVNVADNSNEIFVVNTDGTGVKRLTTNAAVDENPAFTTDGTKVIFDSYRDGNAELYSMNPDGTGQTRLTYNIELDTEPATRARKITRKASLK